MTDVPTATGATGATVRLAGVRQAFGATTVLAGLDLDVAAGESVAVLGRSGSGKTTLLRLIAGLDAAVAGTVRIGGALVSDPGIRVPPHKRGLGLVPQDSALWPHMDVAGNVLFGLRRNQRPSQRLSELLASVGLSGYAARCPAELSGGEARRVALARALAPEPRLLLMDEPLTNLDWETRDELVKLVNRTVRGKATLLLVTHHPDEARQLADRRLLLEDGRLKPLL